MNAKLSRINNWKYKEKTYYINNSIINQPVK